MYFNAGVVKVWFLNQQCQHILAIPRPRPRRNQKILGWGYPGLPRRGFQGVVQFDNRCSKGISTANTCLFLTRVLLGPGTGCASEGLNLELGRGRPNEETWGGTSSFSPWKSLETSFGEPLTRGRDHGRSWKNMSQMTLALRGWGHHSCSSCLPGSNRNHWRVRRRQLKKILGALKELQVLYQKVLSGTKETLFQQPQKLVYVSKEKSLVPAGTQISGLEEQVEKILQSTEQIIQRDGNKEENLRLGE